VVLLYEESEIGDAIRKAEELRDKYSVALFVKPKKLGKFLNRLEDQGYDGFMVYGRDEEVRFFSE
jgi:histidyl-tRNA synthetase